MSIYEYNVVTNDGKTIGLNEFKGKVLLIVNVASRCGFTPQYKGLENLYKKYRDKGFEILAFPCNQFGAQEPGEDEEIKSFCDLNYNISFPLFSKIEVNGDNTHPLYNYLKESLPGILGTKAVKWNFTKFVVNSQGLPVSRHASNTKPEDLESEIKALLDS